MRFRLATRFSATIAGILTLSIVSSLVALYAAWRVDRRLEQAHQEELPSVRAEEVEILLLERNSLVAAQLLDKDNPIWTKNLGRSQGQFQQWITKVRSSTAVPPDEEDLLRRLEKKWADLDAAQQKAIELHGQGNAEKAKTLLLTEIREHLSKDAYDLCEQLIASNDRYVKQIMERADTRIRVTTWVVALSVCLTLGLGGTLVWMFLYRVLLPLRGMVADARLFRGADGGMTDEDELRSMGSYFRELMSDVTDTRSRLERSRLRLAAAEKLAAVGKLAATVAHEIRNPLTAMKMWLFAIQERVRGDAESERQLGIISEEITRLENIIRQFSGVLAPHGTSVPAAGSELRRQADVGPVRATSEGSQHSCCHGRDRHVARDPGRRRQAQAGLHQPYRQCARCHGPGRRDPHRHDGRE